jgi:ABC-2 type transport system ATP-binding protein
MAVEHDSAVIVADGVRKKFGDVVAVENATFDVPRGSIFGFIGPSGSGKTTTIRLLTGIYSPTSGKISVLGSSPKRFSRRTRARIGYMPQLFELYPNLTIWENLNFAASLYGMGLSRAWKLHRMLDLVELDDKRDTVTEKASGGMQRRLSLAATLLHDPELVFLDEPTAGIDPILRQKFWHHFRDLQSQQRTLFITTQYVSEAAYCDLVAIMAEGQVLSVDTPTGLRHQAYGGEMINLVTLQPLATDQEQTLRALPFVKSVTRTGFNSLRIVVDQAKTAMPDLVEWFRGQNIDVQTIEEFEPPFEDVFVQLVKQGKDHA